MTTLYTAFLPEVAPHCEGAPERQVTNAIRNACIDFCEGSWTWQQELTGLPLVLAQQDYTLTGFTTGGTVAEILYAYYNDKPLHPMTRSELDEKLPRWRTMTGTTPQTFFAKDGGTIASLVPKPSAATVSPNLIAFTVALKPTRASTFVQDWLYEKYLTDIAHGALALLYAMPKKAWTNANLAGMHKAQFMDAIGKARVLSSQSFTRAKNRNRNCGVARW